MINSLIVICPQCRKRLDRTPDVEVSPAVAAVSMNQVKASRTYHYDELDTVRTRPGQGVHTFIVLQTKSQQTALWLGLKA